LKVNFTKNIFKALIYLAMRDILILEEKGKLVVTRGHSVLLVAYGITHCLYLLMCGKADASIVLFGIGRLPLMMSSGELPEVFFWEDNKVSGMGW
jgi:hypothetical protein